MSVCDEGWGETGSCPCFDSYAYETRHRRCLLGIYRQLQSEPLPDSCPHAAALRAVVENPEMVLVAVGRTCISCRKKACVSDAYERCRDAGYDQWEAR